MLSLVARAGASRAARRGRLSVAIVTVAVCVGLTGCSTSARHSGATTPSSSASSRGVVQAMPVAGLDGGHFADPYPIDVSQGTDGQTLTAFSGTFNELAICRGTVRPGCFSPSTLNVTLSASLAEELRNDGDSVVLQTNHNIYRMPNKQWDMALSLAVRRGADTWKLDLHASPVGDARRDGIPSQWVADTILVGSPTQPAPANYDAKYFDASGRLYLVYSRNLSSAPTGSDGLVAQQMISPTQPSSAGPVVLLAPSETDGGLASERADPTKAADRFALVETGNITEINSVWVLVYSTGTVDHANYKVGVAYSDVPVPRDGYRKVLMPDPGRVWGTSGDEVDYLLQSQKSDWPHYVGASVQAPGVGSIVHRGGNWYLFFAADTPAEQTTARGTLNPHLRYLYDVQLAVDIPRQPLAVHEASDKQLAAWLTPILRN